MCFFFLFLLDRRAGPPPHPFEPRPLHFVWLSCEGNLHHFLGQTFVPLFLALLHHGAIPPIPAAGAASEDLESPRPLPAAADLHFHACAGATRTAWAQTHSRDGCHGPRYQPLLDLLPIHRGYEGACTLSEERAAQLSIPPLLPPLPRVRCYREAVWPLTDRFDYPAFEFLAHRVLRGRGFDCGSVFGAAGAAAGARVLFLDREVRRIVNLVELLAAAAALLGGHVAAHATRFEGLPLEAQIRAAACADVMVGVHGAGLQLASLAGVARGGGGSGGGSNGSSNTPSPSALIELSHAKWGSYYTGAATKAPNRLQLSLAREERVDNLTSFREAAPRAPWEGPWPADTVKKFSDVRVDVSRFMGALRRAVRHVLGDKF